VRSFGGKRVLITGGSSGIGLATARGLVQQGARVCLAARGDERLRAAVAELSGLANASRVSAGFVIMDVTDGDSVERGLRAALEQLGGLDMLVNCAGFAVPGYVEALDEDVYRAMLETNYLGPVRVIRASLGHFIGQRSGTIVNVASMAGFMGLYGYGAYCGSKFALSGFTECLRQDLLPHAVTVHLCYPPTTRTPGLARENEIKPAETWALEGSSRAFSPDQVAAGILRGVRRGRFQILVGFDSWTIWLLQRFAPSLVRRACDRVLRRHWRRHGPPAARDTSEA
jgi:3-dehydrosphinganine reductase